MSEPEDFLSRWSRRKSEANRSSEAAIPADNTTQDSVVGSGVEKDAPTDDARPKDERTSSATPANHGVACRSEPMVDLASLPDIDSIAADTDITGFLKPGVPDDLRHAALRRAFAADPNIWNYIERAEYDWDFNAPESIPGFGPLEMTQELRREVARLVGDAWREQPPAASAAMPAAQPSEIADGSQPVPVPGEGLPADATAPARESQVPDDDPRQCKDDIATQQESGKVEKLQTPARRNHGGALPKSSRE
jgi:hypothetical protein